jgi:hypothetical protein
MTYETAISLSPEERRIRIAKACGYKWPPPRDEREPLQEIFLRYGVPDFCGSLDAMAVAEKTLNRTQKFDYAKYLESLTVKNKDMIAHSYYEVDTVDTSTVFASAEQRAIAFLMTTQP